LKILTPLQTHTQLKISKALLHESLATHHRKDTLLQTEPNARFKHANRIQYKVETKGLKSHMEGTASGPNAVVLQQKDS